MKFYFKIFSLFLFAGLLFLSCDDSFDSLVDNRLDDNPVPDPVSGNAGTADFTNYVAIGNSLTAGFMDAALYNAGQRFSLGALLSEQLELAGGPEVFNQPDINSVNGFNTSVNSGEGPILGRFKLDTSIPGPSPTINGDPIGSYSGSASDLNNFGVPGVTVGQLLTPDTGVPGTAGFNPFYARFASSPGTSTIMSDVVSSGPTFFTLWIGNNDVLGFALSGATNQDILTDPGAFQDRYSAVINTLMENTQAKGVVANIPPILAIPFVRAVPYDAIGFDPDVPSDVATVETLNDAFSGLNQVLDGIVQFPGHPQTDANRRKVNYSAGSNPILIRDPNLENIEPKLRQLAAVNPDLSNADVDALSPYFQSRPIEEGELVLLSAASVLGTLADPGNPNSAIGVVIPLDPQFTLTFENLQEIETARGTFNAIIENVVSQANSASTRIGFYDTNSPNSAFLDIFGISDGEPGIRINGTLIQPDFSPNGVFSTDGVHPNARGNAILANEFLRIIEDTFDASIPKKDPLSLPSVQLCSGDCVSQQGGS